MTSFVMVEGFQYHELTEKAQHKVLDWLDDPPLEYETEVTVINEEGDEEVQNVMKYEYPSDWAPEEIQSHCEMNEYLFDKFGDPIHHLVLTEYKQNRDLNSTNNSNTK